MAHWVPVEIERDGVKVTVPMQLAEMRNATHSRFMREKLEQRVKAIVEDAQRRKKHAENLKHALQERSTA